jgi:CRISPR-associated protein Csm1
MDDKVFQAALAGLLHDIGKFAQRAGELGSRTWDGEAERDYKYQHALYSGDFVEKYVPQQWAKGLSGPARHHRPQTHHDRVVALADQLSAGERADKTTSGYPQQLLSIFCSVACLKDEQGQSIPTPQAKFLPLKPLEIERAVIFPAVATTNSDYEELWSQFINEVKILQSVHEDKDTADREVYLFSLLKLMQRYTWCIPSAYYRNQPDVSLYDHSRMTAALAACLVEQREEKVQAWLNQQNQNEAAALLVGGDISGVQKFIYTITSDGATPGLRGRSLYLQLLTEVLARYVLQQIGMPIINIIYAGGGHFYLLAPVGCEDKLKAAQKDISRALLQHHQGDLYLALAWEPIQVKEFQIDPKQPDCPEGGQAQNLAQNWKSLGEKLQKVKLRQFAELDDAESLEHLFNPWEDGGNEEKECQVCHKEHPQTKVPKGEEKRKCPSCVGFEKLGDQLRQAQYLWFDEIEPHSLDKNAPAGDWQEILNLFGYQVGVGKDMPKTTNKRRTLLAISDEAMKNLAPTTSQATGRHFLVNVTPIIKNFDEYQQLKAKGIEDLPEFNANNPPIKTFGAMAEQAQGLKRLGILRMDVDNLGRIFSQGLGSKATLSRVAALSFAFSLFFEGWVEQIAQELKKGFGERIYSIYSGGDDLFFVGSWDVMPLLAERISQDLRAFTGGHRGIHVSGGIALIPQKYPLYQAAEDAAEAEGKAKNAKRKNDHDKDALNFLGETILWEKFGEIKARQEKWVGLVKTEEIPKALLQKLMELYAEYDRGQKEWTDRGEEDKPYWGPAQWHTAYSLKRFKDRTKDNTAGEEIADILETLAGKDLQNPDWIANIEWLALSARWAELLTRVAAA